MKAIELELMKQYKYLSNLYSLNDDLYYTETVADMENNDYLQSLHRLDVNDVNDTVVYGPLKRVSSFPLNGKLVIKKSGEGEEIETVYSYLEDGQEKEFLRLSVASGELKELNDRYYLVEGETDRRCPEYYRISAEERKAFHEECEKENDYLVLDEYPFSYNGVGFINGKRNSLFLVDKENGDVKRITPETMDVECVEIKDGKVYLMANDYESMKRMYSSIYCFDPDSGSIETLYENRDESYLRRIHLLNGKVYAEGALDTCISGHSFYEVKDGKLQLACASEWMFYNTIGSDCRYGKTHGVVNDGDKVYLITVDNERSIVVSFDGEKLVKVTDGEGSVDDMAFINGQLYVIAMRDMKLQEVYETPSFRQLTTVNEEVLKDRYVAKPERFTCFNEDEIVGWALKPIDYDPSKKYPMILDIHGGPKTAYGEVFYHEMQVWASKGYFVIFCNPHCSDGKGDDFANYIKHYGATDYFDIMAFVDKALELYPIDPERLAVTGGSYGGYMTNWIVTHTDRFKAAASQRSISNRVADFYYSDYSYDTTYENGIPLDRKAIELFWDRSPLKYVENAVTPTLFIQSTEDYRCPFPEALQLFSALKWKGVETRICGFKGENHELSRSGKPLHRIRRLEEITDWLVSHTS
ncbi:MAG: S9 family peptidase [Erysipelotrichaceae bacterium]|nr:S9 family peptidase [Erysipelotrichaceae bacterium]